MSLSAIRTTKLKATQSELAHKCGVTQSTVSKWENGSLEPSRAELAAIRDFARELGYDLTADELIGNSS